MPFEPHVGTLRCPTVFAQLQGVGGGGGAQAIQIG